MEDLMAQKILPTSYVQPTVHARFPTGKISLVDHSIEQIQPCTIYPESTDLNAHAPIDFIIHDSALHYIDLGSIQLEVSLSLKKADGTAAAAADLQVYFTNNLLSSLFPIRKCYINNTCVETQYAGNHIGRMKHLLNISNEVANNRGQSRGLFPLAPNRIASPITAGVCDANDDRKEFSKKDAVILKGHLELDIASCSMWLLDLCTFKLSLETASDKVVINSNAAAEAYQTKINSIKLHFNRIKPSTGGFINTTKLLQKSNMEYVFTKHVLHTELLAAGQNTITINRPFNNRIPHKIYLFMVKQDADNGSYTEDPGFYRTNGINNYRVMIDGKTLVDKDIDTARGAVSAFVDSLNAHNGDHFIPFEMYCKGGFLLVIKTNHSQNNELSFDQKGNLSIHLKFAHNVNHNQMIYTFGVVHSTFEITADRNCITNYSY